MAETTATLISRTRRLLKDTSITSPNNTDSDITAYLQDANDTIGMLHQDFTVYVIGATTISPVPDKIDAQLMALNAAAEILMADIIIASGDAILIQTGDIKLDTSKSPANLIKAYDLYMGLFNNLLTSLIINGKTGETSGTGQRVDTYIVDNTSSKSGKSLL